MPRKEIYVPTGNPVGRPTKYKPEYTEIVENIIKTMTCKNIDRYCIVEQLAEEIGTYREKIYRWGEAHPEFRHAIMLWENKRNAVFMQAGLMKKRIIPIPIWTLLAKNWYGITDKVDVVTETHETKTLNVNLNVNIEQNRIGDITSILQKAGAIPETTSNEILDIEVEDNMKEVVKASE